jgi:RNA binding exosome subunit
MTTSGAVLSSKAPVGYIDVRVFAHATEDAERGSTDPIHLQIHFKKHSENEVLEVCRASGLLP